MTTKFQHALRLAALAGGIAILSGCAGVTAEQLDAVRSTAQAAQMAANNAQNSADQAKQAAASAQSTANEALKTAQDAQAAVDATNQRLDRMFKQSQQK
jgi:copper homeostasis protein CutC